jgi:hypothetical protein
MSVARFAISLDPRLAREIKRSAGTQALSAWIADAAREKLRSKEWDDLFRDWEREHGKITEAELRAAEAELRAAAKRQKRRRR